MEGAETTSLPDQRRPLAVACKSKTPLAAAGTVVAQPSAVAAEKPNDGAHETSSCDGGNGG
jgi:hypothetical protein